MDVISWLLTFALVRLTNSGSTHSLLSTWWCRDPNNCAYCFDDYQCTVRTNDTTFQVIKKISRNADLIHLQYIGELTNITCECFKNFTILKTLILTGPISSIQENAFRPLLNLTRFLLSDSEVKQLPENLFHPNNSIQKFEIPSNRFEVLPSSTILKLKHLTYLDVSSNPLKFCQNQSTFLGFENLQNFTHLVFSNISNSSCAPGPQPSPDIFHPLAERITFLNYSGSNFLAENVETFSNFTRLLTLDVSIIAKFSNCPSEFVPYVKYLPPTLRQLHMRKWRTNQAFAPQCAWNRTDVYDELSNYTQRLNLTYVDFKFSDLIFGHFLTKQMLRSFKNVSHLDIGYCRISQFEQNLFDGFLNLATLVLDGNPLGPRRVQLFSNHEQTMNLSMKRASIPTDVDFTYRFGHLFTGFFTLQKLDISRNWLNRMPQLRFHSSFQTELLNLQELNVDDNRMRDFQARVGDIAEENSTLKSIFPNLTALYARRNYLRDITHIPLNIEVLYVGGNQLGELHDRKLTYDTLKKLKRLKILNIDDNHLYSPPNDLLYNMPDLEEIYIYGNNLTKIPKNFFSKNLKLRRVNLGNNRLNSFDVLKAGLSSSLEWIDLTDNSFTILSKETLNAFDNKFPNLTYVALGGNAFDCSCGNSYFQDWIRKVVDEDKDIFMFASRYRCASPEEVENEFFMEYENSFVCLTRPALIKSAIIFGSFLVAALISVFLYKYRWYFRHLPMICSLFGKQLLGIKFYSQCEYDAYISYDVTSDDDSVWVKEVLLRALEKNTQRSEDWKLFIWERNAEAGKSKVVERCDKMSICRKLIIVLSESYMMSVDCLSEAELIGDSMNGTEKYEPNRVLIIIKEQLNQIPLDTVLKTLLTKNALLWKDGDSDTKKENLWLKVGRFLEKGSKYRMNETAV